MVAGNILASLTVEEISNLGLDKTVTVLAAANSDLFSSAQVSGAAHTHPFTHARTRENSLTHTTHWEVFIIVTYETRTF